MSTSLVNRFTSCPFYKQWIKEQEMKKTQRNEKKSHSGSIRQYPKAKVVRSFEDQATKIKPSNAEPWGVDKEQNDSLPEEQKLTKVHKQRSFNSEKKEANSNSS